MKHTLVALISIFAVLMSYGFFPKPVFLTLLLVTLVALAPFSLKIVEGINHQNQFSNFTMNGRTVLTTDGYPNQLRMYFDNMGFTNGWVRGYFY